MNRMFAEAQCNAEEMIQKVIYFPPICLCAQKTNNLLIQFKKMVHCLAKT